MEQSTLALAERVSRISISGTMRVAAEAERLRRQGIDVIDLSAGEPDFPTPEHIKQAGLRAIQDDFTRYTPVTGIHELRTAICERHAADFGASYTPAECVVTAGGKQAVFNFVQALVNPGDEVVIPVPYWVSYRDIACFAGASCVFAPADEENGFAVTAALIERCLGPRTRMIVINSPSNPSGAVLDRDEFARILELASARGIWLLADECYGRLLYEGAPFSVSSLPGAKDNVLIAGSLSKTYAMTGWRLGYGLAPAPVIEAVLRVQSHSTSNASSIAQRAAIEALRGPQDAVAAMLAAYRRRRDFVIRRLRAIPGLRVSEPKGAFYAYPNIAAFLGASGLSSPLAFAELLLEKARVAVVPGEAFGTAHHVRISFAASPQVLERGLDRIHSFIQELPQ